jgi:hypothetical protein
MKNKKNTTKSNQTLFNSNESAAGALGVTVAELRQLKRAGAYGFKANGNVDALELLRWTITKGKDFTPKMTLEEAKTLLAEAQAKEIVRQGKIKMGELAEITEQKRALHFIVWAISIGIRQTLATVAHEIDSTNHAKIAEALRVGFQNQLLNCAAATVSNFHLPDWAVEALKTGAETGLITDTPEEFRQRGQALAEIMTELCAKIVRERLA